jgi:hypothetical protein
LWRAILLLRYASSALLTIALLWVVARSALRAASAAILLLAPILLLGDLWLGRLGLGCGLLAAALWRAGARTIGIGRFRGLWRHHALVVDNFAARVRAVDGALNHAPSDGRIGHQCQESETEQCRFRELQHLFFLIGNVLLE